MFSKKKELRVVEVCAWCNPDDNRDSAKDAAKGIVVTHVMCPSCARKFEQELNELQQGGN